MADPEKVQGAPDVVVADLDGKAKDYPILEWLVVLVAIASGLAVAIPPLEAIPLGDFARVVIELVAMAVLLLIMRRLFDSPHAGANDPAEDSPAGIRAVRKARVVAAIAASLNLVLLAVIGALLWILYAGYTATNVVRLGCTYSIPKMATATSGDLTDITITNRSATTIYLKRFRYPGEDTPNGGVGPGKTQTFSVQIGAILVLHTDSYDGSCIDKVRVDPAWWRRF